MKHDLKQLHSKPFIICNDMTITYNGKDSIMNDFFNNSIKFVIYTDSTSCTSCNVNRMDLWNPFLEYSMTFNGKMKFYFIFHPTTNEIRRLKKSLSSNPINYPVLIDEKGVFERLNPHLPKNNVMHTFLLDENNKVILVGNPLQNKEVEKLFYKITQEKLTK